VHLVLGQVVGAHGLEGAGTHVQGHLGGAHAALAQSGQQGVVKVQGRGGGGHGAGGLGEHRLVAAHVVGIVGVGDVGR